MNILASRRAWILAPSIFVGGIVTLLCCWIATSPAELVANFDADGHSMVELMTLPLFAAVIPLAWLCCPVAGSFRRKAFWSFVFSLLGFMALVRELDWHKIWFYMLWPEVMATFRGTVFKMRFLTSGDVPFAPKLFVFFFFVLFFAATIGPLVYFIRRLIRGIFRLHPVAWTMMFFGATGVMVQTCDRLPSTLRNTEWVRPELLDKANGSLTALMTAMEEGGEMMLAVFALLAILQAHVIYAPDRPDSSFAEL